MSDPELIATGHAILDALTQEEGDELLRFITHLRETHQIPPLPSEHQKALARIAALTEALAKAIDTLAAGGFLIRKYTPDHHWLGEHDRRIAELRATLADPTDLAATSGHE